ncbi:MAG: hypothetical protein HS105_04770 [Chloracidobacterium sp.]|nr:hypothetical protein [Chloracidobacterium sp.]
MTNEQHLIDGLPDKEAAQSFIKRLEERHPSALAKLRRKEALLADVLTIVSYSPLLATTLLRHPEYFWWLERRRLDSGVRGRQEMSESLARFALTNSQLDTPAMYARFRRRELLRIYLRDIRSLATIAEITEEISNLADAILGSALEQARREADNRYGAPQETNEKGRAARSDICIVALGKLGSRELNYSSDIDLLFIYSNEGKTAGNGTKGQITNREYFIKLAEIVIKLVGRDTTEAAYRVDMRLRPYGTLGSLAMSLTDTIAYYKNEARPWERQVLVRSRPAAGDAKVFSRFYAAAEPLIYPLDEDVAAALDNVRRSKEKIDISRLDRRGFDVKLGRGGIREIEFIAQALQRAHGGRDAWLRMPHTLISLDRLADRRLISSEELTGLAAAYAFLRKTEHVLQMENGLQTHELPTDNEKLNLLARRLGFAASSEFDAALTRHCGRVSAVFIRIFGTEDAPAVPLMPTRGEGRLDRTQDRRTPIREAIDAAQLDLDDEQAAVIAKIEASSLFLSEMIAALPALAEAIPSRTEMAETPDFEAELLDAVEEARDFGTRLTALRTRWPQLLIGIAAADLLGEIDIKEAKRRQTLLAEASIKAALFAVERELAHRSMPVPIEFELAVLALGKLGGGGLDYGSDLDLVLVYFDPSRQIGELSPPEFYSRAVELFTNALSSMTRNGNLYRVDLRLRPFGTNGPSAISIDAFLDYMRETAAVWEMLAFVKLRSVGGDPSLSDNVEREMRGILHERARSIDADAFRTESRRMRIALEERKQFGRRSSDIDIKYAAGGMLDVYFAMRYLQLRDNVPDEALDRSTIAMLERLRSAGSLSTQQYSDLSSGYSFLSELDHALRLTLGRRTVLPSADAATLGLICAGMRIASPPELLEQLTLHRLAIRSAFDEILPAEAVTSLPNEPA